jgi:ADP-ribosylglycohydrolase
VQFNALQVVNLNQESGGFVMHSLEASIWCLLKETDFASTVLRAVNLGVDTDTTGAITGGLAGIYYDEIPKKWVTQLARKDDILNLCDRFSNSI